MAASPAEAPRRTRSVWRTIARTPVALFLILLMAVGSVFLWIGIPVGWLYVASRMVKTSQPTLGPYVLVIIGIPITMVIVGKLLFKLDSVYSTLTGQKSEVQFRAPWLKSMRGERDTGRKLTVLEMTMVISVSIETLRGDVRSEWEDELTRLGAGAAFPGIEFYAAYLDPSKPSLLDHLPPAGVAESQAQASYQASADDLAAEWRDVLYVERLLGAAAQP